MSKPTGVASEKKQGPSQDPASHSSPQETGAKKKGGTTPLPGGCLAQSCKVSATRFSFCDEHFEQFKFGLIKKTGEPVSDYEKKFEHYHAYKARRGALKAA